jgi:hypothetical protein
MGSYSNYFNFKRHLIIDAGRTISNIYFNDDTRPITYHSLHSMAALTPKHLRQTDLHRQQSGFIATMVLAYACSMKTVIPSYSFIPGCGRVVTTSVNIKVANRNKKGDYYICGIRFFVLRSKGMRCSIYEEILSYLALPRISHSGGR